MLNTSRQGRTHIIEQRPGYTRIDYTAGIAYNDGYEIHVWWEDEPPDSPHAPGYWCARLSGVKAEMGPLGTGDTREDALCSLCCSLACLADSLFGETDDA